jgi:hypothetical protein
VITGVVDPFATVELKSVPVVPNVKAATEVTVPPEPVALKVPATNDIPVPIVTLLKPPVPLPYKIEVDVPVVNAVVHVGVPAACEVNTWPAIPANVKA